MRGRAAAATAMFALLSAVAITACSLFVSTDDLGGNAVAPSNDGSMPESANDVAINDAALVDGQSHNILDAADGDAGDDILREPHLIGAWFFDVGDEVARVRDRSGHGHDGELKGGAAFIEPSIHGRAIALNGKMDDFFSVPGLDESKFPVTGTLSIWFRYTSLPVSLGTFCVVDVWEDERSHLFLRHPNGAPDNEYQFALQPKLAPYVYAYSFTLPISTWTHAVITWSAELETASIFLDGVLKNRKAYDAAWSPTQQSMIFGRLLNGEIDDIRLYDTVLDDAIITALP